MKTNIMATQSNEDRLATQPNTISFSRKKELLEETNNPYIASLIREDIKEDIKTNKLKEDLYYVGIECDYFDEIYEDWNQYDYFENEIAEYNDSYYYSLNCIDNSYIPIIEEEDTYMTYNEFLIEHTIEMENFYREGYKDYILKDSLFSFKNDCSIMLKYGSIKSIVITGDKNDIR